MSIQKYLPFVITIVGTLPGIVIQWFQLIYHPFFIMLCSGIAIFSVAVILMWACELAQLDVPQALAITIVAIIVVLPEYCVDMYFSWMAGQEPMSMYRNYAVANMTGANRLLIGVGWTTVIIFSAILYQKPIELETTSRTEIVFLLLATIYAFVIPFKGTLAWYDTLIFVGMYFLYISTIAKQQQQAIEVKGITKIFAEFPALYRRIVMITLFLFSAMVIFMTVGLFSENLLLCGALYNIDEFLLIQWLTPIASELPEFIVAIMLVLRGSTSLSLRSLLSAKLNQWTLLIGMIPLIYAFSFGSINPPMAMSRHQSYEILLTASQSLFAICLLLNLYIGIREAIILFIFFILQCISSLYTTNMEISFGLYHNSERFLIYFSIVYVILSLCIIMRRYNSFLLLQNGFLLKRPFR